MLIINLYMADDLVMLVTGARRIERKEEAPELWRMVENLAITAGVPMPRIYIVPDDSPNAFAAGRTPKQAIVCRHDRAARRASTRRSSRACWRTR